MKSQVQEHSSTLIERNNRYAQKIEKSNFWIGPNVLPCFSISKIKKFKLHKAWQFFSAQTLAIFGPNKSGVCPLIFFLAIMKAYSEEKKMTYKQNKRK
jgi:hypothetical protein